MRFGYLLFLLLSFSVTATQAAKLEIENVLNSELLRNVQFYAETDKPLDAKEEPELSYTNDVSIQGIAYEKYLSRTGDNVLIRKDVNKKNGIYLFESARHLLRYESLFTVGLSAIPTYTSWNRAKIAKELSSKPESLSINPDSDELSLQKLSYPLELQVRAPFYRHLKLSGGLYMFPGGDTSAHARIRQAWLISADHDLIVIPKGNRLNALSIGYYLSRADFIQTIEKDYGDRKEFNRKLSHINESGFSLSLRTVFLNDDTLNVTLEAKYEQGRSGTKRLVTLMRVGM